MSLTGTFIRSLDSKQRVALPRRYREELAVNNDSRLYVAPESDRALGLYGTAVFRQRASRLESQAGSPGRIQTYMRLYYSQAEEVEIDSQGRIRIPDRLVSFAHLRQDVVLLGVHDHVELWDQGVWEQFLSTHGADFDRLASEAFAPRLPGPE